MKKIKTVFVIDRETNLATSEVNKGAEWVLGGEGIATIKVDGSACMVQNGVLYKRYDRKLQSKYAKQARELGAEFKPTDDMFNILPGNAIPCQESPDPVTFHHPHWVEIDKNKPEDKFHIQALEAFEEKLEDGTYELIGSKVNGNPYKMDTHQLVKHGTQIVELNDRSPKGLKKALEELNGEGFVFYHPDGDMKKYRRKDEGLEWGHTDTRNLREKKKFKR